MTLRVNGEERSAVSESRQLLSDFLRHQLGLTGTHVGCEHGVCGACTVLLDGEPVRSCLLFAVQCEGSEITTVEGLAGPDGELHPLQEAFRDAHALQCGFCTPGFLMSLLPLYDSRKASSVRGQGEGRAEEEGARDLSDEELREHLSGNLCRCTGYQNIVKAAAGALNSPDGDADGAAGTARADCQGAPGEGS